MCCWHHGDRRVPRAPSGQAGEMGAGGWHWRHVCHPVCVSGHAQPHVPTGHLPPYGGSPDPDLDVGQILPAT